MSFSLLLCEPHGPDLHLCVRALFPADQSIVFSPVKAAAARAVQVHHSNLSAQKMEFSNWVLSSL